MTKGSGSNGAGKLSAAGSTRSAPKEGARRRSKDRARLADGQALLAILPPVGEQMRCHQNNGKAL